MSERPEGLYTDAELDMELAADMRACPIAYFVPRPYAVPFMLDDHMVVFAFGGKRSAKTWHVTAKNVVAMTGIDIVACPGVAKLFHPPPVFVRHWTPKLTDAEELILPLYLKWIPPDLLDVKRGKNGFNVANHSLYLRNGSLMQFRSYEQDDIKGESFECYIVSYDEPPKEKIYESQYARIVTVGGYMYGAMTLDERRTSYPIQWIDRRIRRKGDGDHVAYHHFKTDQNIAAIAQEKGGREGQRVRDAFTAWTSSVSEEERMVVIEGFGGWLSGLVYKEFDERIHASYAKATVEELVTLANEGHGHIRCGLDYGLNHPTACIWDYVNHYPIPDLDLAEGDVIQFAEYKEPGRTVDQNVLAIQARSRGMKVQAFYADPAMWTRNPRGGLTIAGTFIKAGLRLVQGANSKDVGWDAVHKLLAVPPPGSACPWPKLRLMKGRNRKTCDEFLAYQWKPESERSPSGSDKDVDRDDDLMDARRYVATTGRPLPAMVPRHRIAMDPTTGVPLNLFFAGYRS